jgi:NifU-like N terminal domain
MRYSGRLIDELTRLDAGEIERALDGLPDDRKHAADVAAGAVRAAAARYQARRD